MKNQEIAEIFERIANILEFKGELPFKLIAYRKASRILKSMNEDIADAWKNDSLESTPGIGSALAKKIDQYLREGRIELLDRLLKEVPSPIIELLKIKILEPKSLRIAYEQLGVKTISDLKRVVESGELASLPGINPKKMESIKVGIRLIEKTF